MKFNIECSVLQDTVQPRVNRFKYITTSRILLVLVALLHDFHHVHESCAIRRSDHRTSPACINYNNIIYMYEREI